MDENITLLSKMARFYLFIWNDKSRQNMSPKLKDIVRQMNTYSADKHGYIASISFSNDYITNVFKCTIFISYLLK